MRSFIKVSILTVSLLVLTLILLLNQCDFNGKRDIDEYQRLLLSHERIIEIEIENIVRLAVSKMNDELYENEEKRRILDSALTEIATLRRSYIIGIDTKDLQPINRDEKREYHRHVDRMLYHFERAEYSIERGYKETRIIKPIPDSSKNTNNSEQSPIRNFFNKDGSINMAKLYHHAKRYHEDDFITKSFKLIIPTDYDMRQTLKNMLLIYFHQAEYSDSKCNIPKSIFARPNLVRTCEELEKVRLKSTITYGPYDDIIDFNIKDIKGLVIDGKKKYWEKVHINIVYNELSRSGNYKIYSTHFIISGSWASGLGQKAPATVAFSDMESDGYRTDVNSFANSFISFLTDYTSI
ncbi:MAG: hypothetical protein MI974_26540 [Chitinophagales bacterium]|nr:hypothetical protein [Chitinophagales bacterium]